MNSNELTLNEALDLQVQHRPEKTFISYKKESISFKEVSLLVNKMAGYLVSAGVGEGDKICLMLPRTPELVISFLAASRIGALIVPVNYLLPSNDIVQFIGTVAPKILIAQSKLVSEEVAQILPSLKGVSFVDTESDLPNWISWQDLVSYTGILNSSYTAKIDDVAYQNFTTGSSGNPKGAMATHANLYWNTLSSIEIFELTSEDVHLCMFGSFAHPHELFVRALYTGGRIVLLQEINPKAIVRKINEQKVTCMMGLAPMYEAMAKHCKAQDIPTLRVAESGGMYTREDINQQFQSAFGIPIFSAWGSTETSGIALTNNAENYRTDGSMGKICPYYQVKLMDGARQVKPGEVGELYFKGPAVVSGYEGFPPLLNDGWYSSGDMAKVTEDGFYYFVERRSGMIKMAGLKVYPLQVELVLITHPKIKEVAVLGVSDKRKGAVPKAVIVTESKARVDLDEIRAFCKGKMPSYMVPKSIDFLEELPKIGSGKINKKVLQKMYDIQS